MLDWIFRIKKSVHVLFKFINQIVIVKSKCTTDANSSELSGHLKVLAALIFSIDSFWAISAAVCLFLGLFSPALGSSTGAGGLTMMFDKVLPSSMTTGMLLLIAVRTSAWHCWLSPTRTVTILHGGPPFFFCLPAAILFAKSYFS